MEKNISDSIWLHCGKCSVLFFQVCNLSFHPYITVLGSLDMKVVVSASEGTFLNGCTGFEAFYACGFCVPCFFHPYGLFHGCGQLL